MAASMVWNLVAVTIVINASAQCGPNADKPYPPGTTTCPAGPEGGTTGGTQGGRDGSTGGSAPGGSAPGGSATCSNPTCNSPPCATKLLGDIGCTTVSGTEQYAHELTAAGATIASNGHIFGPFEAGFSAQQASIIQNWGCTDPSVAYDTEGGTDVGIAEDRVSLLCDVELPRVEGNKYIGIVGECGGHTSDYHFHRAFKCLFTETGTHSTKVGVIAQWNIYAKWEDYSQNRLPYLDACGGHFGLTPESPSANVYHYHAQDRAPFTAGCHGPSQTGGLVTLAECRALYSECGDDTKNIPTKSRGTVVYDVFCPCYDGDGSNVGNVELPAIAASPTNWYSAAQTGSTPRRRRASSPTPSASPSPSASLAPSPSPSPSARPSPSPSATSSASPSPSRQGGGGAGSTAPRDAAPSASLSPSVSPSPSASPAPSASPSPTEADPLVAGSARESTRGPWAVCLMFAITVQLAMGLR